MTAPIPYAISNYTDNTIGILNKISIIFTRRRLNIESINVSETERLGVSRFTILVKSDDRRVIEKLVLQIRRIVEVMAVYGYEDQDWVSREIALYKIVVASPDRAAKIAQLAAKSGAAILHSEKHCVVLQKTGTEEEIYALFGLFKPFGIIEFVRSGKIGLSKKEKGLSEYLPNTEWEYHI